MIKLKGSSQTTSTWMAQISSLTHWKRTPPCRGTLLRVSDQDNGRKIAQGGTRSTHGFEGLPDRGPAGLLLGSPCFNPGQMEQKSFDQQTTTTIEIHVGNEQFEKRPLDADRLSWRDCVDYDGGRGNGRERRGASSGICTGLTACCSQLRCFRVVGLAGQALARRS